LEVRVLPGPPRTLSKREISGRRPNALLLAGMPVCMSPRRLSEILRYALDRTAGKNNSIRDRSPQSLIHARPIPGSPGSFDPIERHANHGVHFRAGAAHYGEQFARKAEACAPPREVASRFLKHGDVPADLFGPTAEVTTLLFSLMSAPYPTTDMKADIDFGRKVVPESDVL
jgi:hypothetical protein